MNLQGKRAVITGASQGLGLTLARAFLSEGASVMICARSAGDLERAQRQLESIAPGRIYSMVADIGIESDIDALAAETRARLGGSALRFLDLPGQPVEDRRSGRPQDARHRRAALAVRLR